MDGQPRRRSGDGDRRRWSEANLDLFRDYVDDRLAEVVKRMDRYWSELQDLRRNVDALNDACERDAREVRARLDRLIEVTGLAPLSQPQRTNWREFFTYLFISVGGLGVSIAGILLASHA